MSLNLLISSFCALSSDFKSYLECYTKAKPICCLNSLPRVLLPLWLEIAPYIESILDTLSEVWPLLP